MTTKANDQMGGFVSAQFISTSRVSTFLSKNGKVNLDLYPDAEFEKLDIIKNGVSVNVDTSTEEQGEIVTISATIKIKDVTSPLYIPINKSLLLLTDPLGRTWVYGTARFPLRMSASRVSSDNPAGWSGVQIHFEGRQTTLPLLLDI